MAVSSVYRSRPLTARQLPSWTFDPVHTEVCFSSRRLGAMWVNGHFRDVRGTFYWDDEHPLGGSCVGEIDVASLHVEDPCLNTQLRTADFLEPSRHPTVNFAARLLERRSDTEFAADVQLTIRGATRHVAMDLTYLGQWQAPVVVGGEQLGMARRLGVRARGAITRRQFEQQGVTSDPSPGEGTRRSSQIDIALDVEAILDTDLRQLSAVDL